ncbi:MAG: calcium/sodium antiporter [Desulfobacterales bacterium]
MTLSLVLFVIGLIIIYYGAEFLVSGASALAHSLGMSPMVIGLTVVAFGTSAPETFVSVVSSLKGKSMIAVGNVIGSNICNIALVLGLSAVFSPIPAQTSVIRRDIPIMIGVSLYLLVISYNSVIGRFEGITLITGVFLYTFLNYYIARREFKKLIGKQGLSKPKLMSAKTGSRLKQTGLVTTGIAGVVAGAELMIESAINIMSVLGVSEKFIGLTIVAFGTSLPELATSAVAAWKKEMDISLGNLVGSNVFNILCVLGAASLVKPIVIPGGFIQSGLIFDYLVMIFISFLPWLMMRTRYKISRNHGLFLLWCYSAYLAVLIIKS